MRPIDRGERHTRFNWRGKVREEQDYSRYTQARRYLIDRLGAYCSYCEQKLPNPAVEHIFPKSIHDHLELDWENFLLACTNCNATKGDTDINEANIAEYYWPHLHNTFLAFQYNNLGLVTPSTHEHVDFQRARNTINLFGLDKVAPRAGTIAYEDASDLRFENRIKAWHYAEKWEFNYRQAEDGVRTLFRELLPSVLDSGFFSIWMTVFNNHLEVKELIINSFSGTAKNCFDQHYHPINRH
jgi:uncharacterized protein (TIGR02646 family)